MREPFRIRAKHRIGRCYELAFRGILRSAAATLVHGECRGPNGSRIGHAWLVVGNRCYDPVDDKFYVDYCALFDAVPQCTYTQAQAAALAAKTGHCGPWGSHEHDHW